MAGLVGPGHHRLQPLDGPRDGMARSASASHSEPSSGAVSRSGSTPGRQPRRLGQQRRPGGAAQPLDLVHGGAAIQAQRRRHLRRCRHGLAAQHGGGRVDRPGRAARRGRSAAPAGPAPPCGAATKVPAPPRRSSRPRRTSPSSAWRSVMRETRRGAPRGRARPARGRRGRAHPRRSGRAAAARSGGTPGVPGRGGRSRPSGSISAAPSAAPPSMRIVSPFTIGLRTIAHTRSANSSGRPSRGGFGTEAPSATRGPAPAALPAAACRTGPARCRRRGCRVRARSRAAGSTMPGDAALRRAVGDLADLALERGDRRRQHDHAALALGVRLVAGHRRRGGAQRVERADQVHLDRAPERVVVVPDHAADGADARARDAHAQGRGCRRRRNRRRQVVRAASRRPRTRRRPAARSRRVTASPSAARRAAVAAPRPDAPPVTSALASHRRYRRRRAAAVGTAVGDPGFEPGTSSLSERRSNQLS